MICKVSLIALALVVASSLVAAGELDPYLARVDRELASLEAGLRATTKELFWDQQTEEIGRLAVSNQMTSVEITRAAVMRHVLESLRKFLGENSGVSLDGSKRLAPGFYLTGSLLDALHARAKVRARVDGFRFSQTQSQLLFKYIEHYGVERAADAPLRALVRSYMEKVLVPERELSARDFEAQSAAGEVYFRESGLAAERRATFVFGLDQIIDELVGCPSCADSSQRDEEDESGDTEQAFDAYPMFRSEREVFALVLARSDARLTAAMRANSASIARRAARFDSEEILDVDLGDFDELVAKVGAS